ncbi:MAG: Uma2 family endonuclease [Planctomycetota bacterium]
MQWSDILADPSLQDLPYKIETNQYGQIVMSPASNQQGFLQVEIAAALRVRATGRVYSEASIDTGRGVKVADVAWCSDAFHAKHGPSDPFPAAPELCVEVRSPSNSRRELDEKRALYFAAGATEVWECDLQGAVTFFGPAGELTDSTLFAGFPKQIG